MNSVRVYRCTVGGLLVLVLAILALRPLCDNTDDAQGGTFALVVDNRDLAVGPVDVSTRYSHDITVRNVSDEAINIEDFVTSCACVSVMPESTTIPAGESIVLTATIDLTKYFNPESSESGTIDGSIILSPVANGAVIAEWPIHITMRRPLLFVRSEVLEFGKIQRPGEELFCANPLYVYRQVDPPAVVNVPAGISRVTLTPLTAGVGEYSKYRLSIIRNTPLPSSGNNAFELTITTQENGSKTFSGIFDVDWGVRWHFLSAPDVVTKAGGVLEWHIAVVSEERKILHLSHSIDYPHHCECDTRQDADGTHQVCVTLESPPPGSIHASVLLHATLEGGIKCEERIQLCSYVRK